MGGMDSVTLTQNMPTSPFLHPCLSARDHTCTAPQAQVYQQGPASLHNHPMTAAHLHPKQPFPMGSHWDSRAEPQQLPTALATSVRTVLSRSHGLAMFTV